MKIPSAKAARYLPLAHLLAPVIRIKPKKAGIAVAANQPRKPSEKASMRD
jgi:hypothetical protein